MQTNLHLATGSDAKNQIQPIEDSFTLTGDQAASTIVASSLGESHSADRFDPHHVQVDHVCQEGFPAEHSPESMQPLDHQDGSHTTLSSSETPDDADEADGNNVYYTFPNYEESSDESDALNGLSSTVSPDYVPRAGVTGDYPSIARNERILSNPMLNPTQSRRKKQFLQEPSLDSAAPPRDEIKLVPPTPGSSRMLTRRVAVAAAAISVEPPASEGSTTALFELASPGSIARPCTPLPESRTTIEIGHDSTHATVSICTTLTLSDLITSFPLPPCHLGKPLRVTQIAGPTHSPQPTPRLYHHRRRRSSLLSSVHLPEDGQEQPSPSTEKDESDLNRDPESDLERGGYSGDTEDKPLPVLPKDPCFKTAITNPRRGSKPKSPTSKWPLTQSPVLSGSGTTQEIVGEIGEGFLSVGDSERPVHPLSTKPVGEEEREKLRIDQATIGNDNLPISTSDAKWSAAAMEDLAVSCVLDIQTTMGPFEPQVPHIKELSDATDKASLQSETSAVQNQPQMSAEMDRSPRAILESFNSKDQFLSSTPNVEQVDPSKITAASSLLLPPPDQAEERRDSGYTSSSAGQRQRCNGGDDLDGQAMISLLSKHKTLLDNDDASLDEETALDSLVNARQHIHSCSVHAEPELVSYTEAEDPTQSVLSWAIEGVRANFDILKFTAAYNAVARHGTESDDYQDLDGSFIQVGGDDDYCEFMDDYIASSLGQSCLDGDSDTNTPDSSIDGLCPSSRMVSGAEPGSSSKALQTQFDTMISQLDGLLSRLSERSRRKAPRVCVVPLRPRRVSARDEEEEKRVQVDSAAKVDSTAIDKTGEFYESLINDVENFQDADGDGEDGSDGGVDGGDDELMGVMDEHCRDPNKAHRLYDSHPHLRELYPPQTTQVVNFPERMPYLLDEHGNQQAIPPTNDLPHPSTWTFHLGSHFTQVVNSTVTVTCEACLRQFVMTPDNLDILARHQAGSCCTSRQQNWQRGLLAVESFLGLGVAGRRAWEAAQIRHRKVFYGALSRSINWMMDRLMEQLDRVQELNRDVLSVEEEKGEDGKLEEKKVLSVFESGCASWHVEQGDVQKDGEEKEVFFDALEAEEHELDEVNYFRWL
ncbi:hypothetical protein BGX23_005667 [Mortierella sp. AD031]|nr:hypothetical protein BGX23_005667 [Mortierella sp. AD031]